MWIDKTALGRRYRLFQQRAVAVEAPGIPDPVNRNFVNLRSFETVQFIRRLVGEAERLLIVGDAFGRESFSLRSLAKSVTVLDIAPQVGLKGFVLGNVSHPLPFRDQTFDAIVVSEVIEHLIDDHRALLFLRDALADYGKLVISVPFVHDMSAAHVRVHTPKTIVRLLQATGFETRIMVQRGGLIVFDKIALKLFLHGINWLALLLLGRVFYRPILSVLAEVDWRLGLRGSRLLRLTSAWGGYLLAVKGEPYDFVQLNAREYAFCSKGPTSEMIAEPSCQAQRAIEERSPLLGGDCARRKSNANQMRRERPRREDDVVRGAGGD